MPHARRIASSILSVAFVATCAASGCTSLLGDFDVGATDDGGVDGTTGGGRANGETCAADGECASGHCADGVCCDTACDGVCEACNLAVRGTCSAIPDGTDPEDECKPLPPLAADGGVDADASDSGEDAADAADGGTPPDAGGPLDGAVALEDASVVDAGAVRPAECAGKCNGRRACAYPTPTTTCGPGRCSAADTELRYRCDGRGNCALGENACVAYACEGEGCKTTCNAPDDCLPTHYCGASRTCVPKAGKGVACDQGFECASGFCVQGVCCDSKCDVPGGECAQAGSLGTCRCTRDCGTGSCVLWYIDADGDGYGRADGTIAANTARLGCDNLTPPAGFVANNGDCNDGDGRMFPGQTQWYDTPSSGLVASYDYNCDGTIQKELREVPGGSCRYCGPPKDCTSSSACSVANEQAKLTCTYVTYTCRAFPAGFGTCEGCGVEPGIRLFAASAITEGFTANVACGSSATYRICGSCSQAGFGVNQSMPTRVQRCH
jgi:hypothetical protein